MHWACIQLAIVGCMHALLFTKLRPAKAIHTENNYVHTISVSDNQLFSIHIYLILYARAIAIVIASYVQQQRTVTIRLLCTIAIYPRLYREVPCIYSSSLDGTFRHSHGIVKQEIRKWTEMCSLYNVLIVFDVQLQTLRNYG